MRIHKPPAVQIQRPRFHRPPHRVSLSLHLASLQRPQNAERTIRFSALLLKAYLEMNHVIRFLNTRSILILSILLLVRIYLLCYIKLNLEILLYLRL